MPRNPRIIIPQLPYHITHRGNNRQNIFDEYPDYAVYLDFLKKQSETYGLIILAYCLMTNHIHLVVKSSRETSISNAIGKSHANYSQYYNRKHKSSGHVWENRFHSVPVGEEGIAVAVRYVERNPVVAGLVENPLDYPWSSASAHASGEDKWELVDMQEWRRLMELYGIDWAEFIQAKDLEEWG